MMRLPIFPQLELSIDQGELSQPCQRLRQFLNRHDLPPKIIHDVEMALKEMEGNIVRYEKASSQIFVRVEIYSKSILIRIADNGIRFDPTGIVPPNMPPDVPSEATHGGSGVYMVRDMVVEIG